MAAPQPRQLARLQIPPPMGQQQPFVYGDSAPMYSPSLPTAIQVGAHNAFPMHQHPNPLQTPMQAAFFPRQPPGAPPRPIMHRAHPSVVQLAAAGILPPGVPMTPLGQVGFPAPMLPPPFVPRSKRTQSVSTGGPPKAVLGGPQRKVSPLPPPVAAVVAATAPKTKKIIVNIPEETMREGEDKGARKDWARVPLPISEIPSLPVLRGPDLVTAEPYPPDAWRHHLPDTIDVFLPGKVQESHCVARALRTVLNLFVVLCRLPGKQSSKRLLKKNWRSWAWKGDLVARFLQFTRPTLALHRYIMVSFLHVFCADTPFRYRLLRTRHCYTSS